jgi:23S rRNA pseudouridine1911/1915/1917 synthase
MSQPSTLADRLVARYPTAKKLTLRRMVADGRVRVNDRVATRYNQPVVDGDVVAVDEQPGGGQRAKAAAAAAERRRSAVGVVFEDADLLVVNKPAGLLTSTVPKEPRQTLLALVREHLTGTDGKPGRRQPSPIVGTGAVRVGLIHRLDRDASGLLVFSKTDEAYHALKTRFFHHDVERVYHAVVRGRINPPTGRIESRLVERTDGSVHSTKQFGKGEPAVTRYETVRSAGRLTLLRVTLQTGRKHQIRVHLSESGCPIVGDRVYGDAKADVAAPRLMLAATRLGLVHPRTGEAMAFELPMPAEFETVLSGPAPRCT